ncbi:MAG: sodium:proton antiporter [Gallionella sp.]|jgi:CPA1 family monovalent cation:H+ antiporter
MTLGIETLGLLLLIAAIVAMMTRKLHVPYSVGLVTTGIVLAFLPVHMEISLTKELIFSMLLPPLIFEAAYFLHWQELRRDFWLITTLASAGVLISAAVTAAGMHYLSGWQWTGAMIFGVLIAATDPVSVIATFKEAGVKGRLRILVEAESLFNDGTAAVLFSIAVAIAAGQVVTPEFVSMALIKTIGGGIGCGALIAGAALLLAGRTQDHLVEITLTTVAAYGSFLLAEHFNLSGVLATLTTGLMMGSIGQRGAISPHGNEAVEAFWEYIAFVANSLIFLLIGIRETQQNFSAIWVVILTAILLVLIGRAMAIYPICWLFSGSKLKVALRHQHTLVWGGLRGALALALALGLPDNIAHHDEIITVAFAVVAFSIFAQGLTMTPMLRRMGEIPRPENHQGKP